MSCVLCGIQSDQSDVFITQVKGSPLKVISSRPYRCLKCIFVIHRFLYSNFIEGLVGTISAAGNGGMLREPRPKCGRGRRGAVVGVGPP